MKLKHIPATIDINSRNEQRIAGIVNINDKKTRYLDVTIIASGEKLDLSGCTVTAIFVIDDVLVNNAVDCTVTNNIVTIPLENFNGRYGYLSIELNIVKDGTVIVNTPIPLKIQVTSSIADSAKISEKTYGTIAETVKEVYDARGTYENLSNRLTGIDNEITDLDESVSLKVNLKADKADTENSLNQKIDTVTATQEIAKAKDEVLTKVGLMIDDLNDKTAMITDVVFSENSLCNYSSTEDVAGTNQYCAVIAPNINESFFIKSASVKAKKGEKITFAVFSKSKYYPQSPGDIRIKFTKEYDVTSVVADENDEAKVEFDVPLHIKKEHAFVAISGNKAIMYGNYKNALYSIFNYSEDWAKLKKGDSSKVAWNYNLSNYSPCYSLIYILESDCRIIKENINIEENLRKNISQYDTQIQEDSTNAVQNKALYNEFNIVEKEIIEPEEISYLNGNKNTVSFQNRSAVRILIPETEPFTVQRIDVNCKTGADVYFGLWTFRRFTNDPSSINYNRGYFTLQRILGMVTSVENHAVLELDDLDIDQNTYHILACTKENALGLLSKDVVSPSQNWSVYNDYSLANTEVGSECSSLYTFNPVYSASETTGFTPAYSVTYKRKNSIEVVTVTNVKEKVKELMKSGGSGGETPVATGGNVLAGKKWAACGDSVTMGDERVKDDEGNYRTYEYFIAKRNGMVLYKDGISGSTMTSGIVGKENIAFSLDRYKDIPKDCDYITIWFGINDNTMSAPLGDISSTDKNTFYGAWNVVMKYIITNIPKAKIGLVVTHMGGTQYHQAVRDIAKKYGVSVFDIPQDSKIPFWCPATSYFSGTIDSEISALRKSQWWVSPAHPSIEGYEYISYPFENWMRSL